MNCAEKLIIRTNNLLKFIHHVTIEIRFRKSLAQERFMSNLEFRNQIIVYKILKKFCEVYDNDSQVTICNSASS